MTDISLNIYMVEEGFYFLASSSTDWGFWWARQRGERKVKASSSSSSAINNGRWRLQWFGHGVLSLSHSHTHTHTHIYIYVLRFIFCIWFLFIWATFGQWIRKKKPKYFFFHGLVSWKLNLRQSFTTYKMYRTCSDWVRFWVFCFVFWVRFSFNGI